MEQPNLKYIKELSEGDLTFETKLISILQKELPEEFEEYTQNFEEKNFKKTAESVHKLKHKISILGLVKGYEIASKFEQDLKMRKEITRHKSFIKVIETMIDFIKSL